MASYHYGNGSSIFLYPYCNYQHNTNYIRTGKILLIVWLSYWNLIIMIIYCIGICILDWIAYFNINKYELVEYHFKNSLFRIDMPLSISVSIMFWLINIPWLDYNEAKYNSFIGYIHMHGLIYLLAFINVFFGNHLLKPNYDIDLLITAGIFVIYFIVVWVAKFKFDILEYQFNQIYFSFISMNILCIN